MYDDIKTKFLSNNLDSLVINPHENDLNQNEFNSGIRNIYFIESIMDTIKVVETELKNHNILSIDCEGIFLSKEGQLTLIQIATPNRDVFIFDILKGGSLMFMGLDNNSKGLKFILENNKILKVIHDCRSDWESLLHQYEVRLHNFIDSQEIYFVYKLIYHQEIIKPISLNNLLIEVHGTELNFKDKMKKKMFENPELWGERPLSKESLYYAAEDVAYLINTWFNLKEFLNENLLEMIYFISILKVVNKTLYHQFIEHLISSVLLYIKSQNTINKEEDKITNKNNHEHKNLNSPIKNSNSQSKRNSKETEQLDNTIDNESINKNTILASYLMNFDYVDYFFQLKSISKTENSSSNSSISESCNMNLYDLKNILNQQENKDIFTEESKNIINLCLSYKNMQREYFSNFCKQSDKQENQEEKNKKSK